MARDLVLILDYGSQYTQLIARRVREARVYCEIHPCYKGVPAELADRVRGVILSGGPASVYADGAPTLDPRVLELGVPVLGICYGMQLLVHTLGGEVESATEREFGRAEITTTDPGVLFDGFGTDAPELVWMSHGDRVKRLPPGFHPIAHSPNSPYAAIGHADRPIVGVQFHPEVHHTPNGQRLIERFLFDLCDCVPDWTMGSFVEEEIARIRAKVGDDHVILGLSGGVDSTVVAALLDRALGARCTCIFVDNGLMRWKESDEVTHFFKDFLRAAHFVHVDASDAFLSQLAGVTDPEIKRKTIGRVFVEVFEAEARKVDGARWLAQGTLYPDVIESVSPHGGPSVSIKSHHNVGGLPERMHLSLLEPLRELFKDEVREVGRELGIPEARIGRHPFPGPGLAVRVLGEVTRARCDVLRQADRIFLDEIRAAGLYDDIWQAFAVLLPVNTVGVMGDERTYENACALRAVTSVDGMTADWFHMPYDVLARCSNRIINEVRGINRVTYDISSKPPGTIEWE